MFATAIRFLAKKRKAKLGRDAKDPNIALDGRQWSGTLRQIVKEKGPLTACSFWEHAQDTGLRSKKQMKMILKWMKEQNHVKLLCRRSPTERIFMYEYVVTKNSRDEAEATTMATANRNDVLGANRDREKMKQKEKF